MSIYPTQRVSVKRLLGGMKILHGGGPIEDCEVGHVQCDKYWFKDCTLT